MSGCIKSSKAFKGMFFRIAGLSLAMNLGKEGDPDGALEAEAQRYAEFLELPFMLKCEGAEVPSRGGVEVC